MKKLILLSLLFVFLSRVQGQDNLSLIPYPQQLEKKIGYFKSTKQEIDKFIKIEQDTTLYNQEAYKLDITPDYIKIGVCAPAGQFYALQTLKQLVELNSTKDRTILLPCVSITDYPAFRWRGCHLDVSRHFFNLDYVKKHIDRMAFYKLNKLHFHITDDQGWRMEIKKYSKLTTEGAYREFNKHDLFCIEQSKSNPDFEIDPRFIKEENGKKIYGGYYTQDELRELVKYAAERNVEIIPEIDMPGHMMAAIKSYPFLVDWEMGWGKIFSSPINPCNEKTYEFVENVMTEVVDIFPSQYIHIGADEVDKTFWEKSPSCQNFMKENNLENVNQLQSYFVERVKKIVESKGKRAIAWDEAMEGGVNSDVTIMYWRGWVKDGLDKAVANGNNIIMAPVNPMYFDTYPNKSSLKNIYNMDVVYNSVPQDKISLIQGVQANMWAEKIPSEARSEFLWFPRLTALAERAWTNVDLFKSYEDRLMSHYPIMDLMGINYRLPDMEGFALESVYVNEGEFYLKSPLNSKKIYFTTDGSTPTKESPVLEEALKIKKPVTINFVLLGENGSKGDYYTVNYKESTYASPVAVTDLKPGLNCDFFNQRIDKASRIADKVDNQFTVENIVVPGDIKLPPSFGLKYTGYIEVPETDIYSFYLTCDDAGMLYIADRLIVDNEGPHSPVEKSGQVALEKGIHPFRLDFVEAGGGYTLYLQYSTGGKKPVNIPNEWLKY